MESHKKKGRKLNLRNSFWSPDYITGIESFLAVVKQDNEQLHQEIDFYRSVNLKCFTPLLESLETTCQANKLQDHRPLGSDTLNKFLLNIRTSGISNLTETCVAPLNKCLKENKMFYNEIEDELHAHYESYQKSWKLAKESYIECQNLASWIVKNLIKLKQDNQPIMLSEDVTYKQEDSKLITKESMHPPVQDTILEGLRFPYKLDETLNFEEEDDFINFLNLLKSRLTVQKSVIPILGASKEYFTGESLILTLKKIDPKLDTSMFNLSRISQTLLTEKIIQAYQNVGGSYFNNFKSNTGNRQTFEIESYYIWNPTLFEKYISSSCSLNSQPRKSYGELTNNQYDDITVEVPRNISGSLSTWFRKVSGTEVTNPNKISTLEEINEKTVHLNSWQDRYFERYQTLLYSRAQLEKALFLHCNKYEKFELKTQQLMRSVVKIFQANINNIKNIQSLPTFHEKLSINIKTNYSLIGFFSRDNSFPFTKWVIHKNEAKSIAYETSFSCNVINEDILKSIEFIIEFIEIQINEKSITREQCLDYWKSDIDLIRATNLERQYIKEFKEMTNDSKINTNVAKIMIERSSTESKFILKDWIDLIKLFQLELPDSLIPMTLHDQILKSKDYSWLYLITLDKLKLIKLIAIHLTKLGDFETLFLNGSDIPFLQYFIRIRGLGQTLEDNAIKLSDILLSLFKDHLAEITSVIEMKTLEANKAFEGKKEEQIPIIKIENDSIKSNEDILLQPVNVQLNPSEPPGHKRSISMTLLSSGLKNLAHEHSNKGDKDEDFVPLPFKTSSTPGSPDKLADSQKRKSGINLLTASTEDLN